MEKQQPTAPPTYPGQNYQGQNHQGQNYQGQNYQGQNYPVQDPNYQGQYQPVPQVPLNQGQPNVVPPNVQVVGMNYRDQLFALCAQGRHERKTEYGMCGIITAIALFPIGLICLFTDSHVKCARCGVSLP